MRMLHGYSASMETTWCLIRANARAQNKNVKVRASHTDFLRVAVLVNAQNRHFCRKNHVFFVGGLFCHLLFGLYSVMNVQITRHSRIRRLSLPGSLQNSEFDSRDPNRLRGRVRHATICVTDDLLEATQSRNPPCTP